MARLVSFLKTGISEISEKTEFWGTGGYLGGAISGKC